MENIGAFSAPAVKMLISDTLRMYVGGYGKRFTWPELADATFDANGDLKTWERRLRSYVEDGGPLMPLDVFMRVFAALPPQAFQRVATRMGFSTAPMEVDGAATVRRAGVVAARISQKVAEALEDGRIDHGELAGIISEVNEATPVFNSIAGGSAPH
ncbi:hypothetical protein [Sphingopyxis flava]|uniref:Uncharacterized protein n=1 Tax=Sphingopyxis flava TaxID=1507287 RepID=A0A1T4ZWG8_9SPHN|nr:hypothetical protein [Sphingopyxis flava]SKB26947.1 hypothetical protein SAMN06295937_1001255 [Sphingopyxis flava]